MNILSKIKNLFSKKPKKLGLALGSGGAKGSALIGALKAFEEEGIKFDMVAGTSIGSIIGGMYASGYSWQDMLSTLTQYDLASAKTLIILKLKGYTVSSYLDEIMGGKNIEETKIPFKAVAVDVFSGEEVVLDSGNMGSAMASSSAIPPIFRAVERDGKKLVDGCYTNPVPADIVKEMGADFVLSINLSSTETNEKNVNFLDATYKNHGVKRANVMQKARDNSNFFLSLDLKDFSAADISKMDEMFTIGYQTTKKEMPKIKQVLKANKIKI